MAEGGPRDGPSEKVPCLGGGTLGISDLSPTLIILLVIVGLAASWSVTI